MNDWPAHLLDLQYTVGNASKTVGANTIGADLIGEISHGPWFGQTYGGGSVIADRKGNILKVGKDRDYDIVIHTFDI